jgi:tRNA(Ile2)-agmatinylcytidine synthase
MTGPEQDYCVVHIGLDDIDLYQFGCTTHAATYLIHELSKLLHIHLLDYLNLVRLNPSIPWKTRGNGAVAIRIAIPCRYIDNLAELTQRIIDDYYAKLCKHLGIDIAEPHVNPGIVIALNPLPPIYGHIYTKALTDVVLPEVVLDKLMKNSNTLLVERYRGRGIVGAAAAIGWVLHSSDYTYELITYRSKYRYLEPRCVDESSVYLFNDTTRYTFNNIDIETNRILVTPHGFDPVLYGVRGDDVFELIKALEMIKVCEPISAWTIFRSNQGTDAHIVERSVSELRSYRTARLRLRILGKPIVIPKGHVIVRAGDSTGVIDLVFFKPSKLDTVAKKLQIGDEVVVHGHAKPWAHEICFHVEKIIVVKQTRTYICKPPRCPLCGCRLTKKGFGKGYKCLCCGRSFMNLELECHIDYRENLKMFFMPPPSEQKHLIKPLNRYGREHKEHLPLKEIPLDTVTKIVEPLLFL